jgi:hypothetical protein
MATIWLNRAEDYMLKLSPKGLKWLKEFHLIAISCLTGGGFALVLLYFLKGGVTDGGCSV